MGKFKKATAGYSYYMGLHMGIGRGPIDELMEIEVGGRTAWRGSVKESSFFRIRAENLFGGKKAEGGIEGGFELYMGDKDQVVSDKLKSMLGGGSQPEFRGVATGYFDGLVSAMNPYPKAWRFKIRRILKGWDGGVWYPEKAVIELTGHDDEGKEYPIKAMNPAHVIYECMTNRDWGRGISRDLLFDSEFRKVADTLFEEGFGICIAWRRQDTLESFIQNILNHISGVLYVDKFTGTFKLKLLRNDYDADNLPVYGFESGLLQIEEATNGAIHGLMNECVVKWFNPIVGKESQVRAQNLALIQTSGAIKSDTFTYEGVPTAKLATIIAERDLRVASTNVRRFTLVCDRRAWRVQPGDVLKISDPKTRGLESVIVRVADTEESKQSDGQIRLSCVQDTFSFDLNTFTGVQDPSFPKPNLNPVPARRLVYEATYAELSSLFPLGEFEAIKPSFGYLRAQAEKGSPVTMAFEMHVQNPATGKYEKTGAGDFTALFELPVDLGYLDRYIRMKDPVDEDLIEVGDVFYVNQEIIMIQSIEEDGLVEIRRGVYDTVPHQHPAGSVVWDMVQGGGLDLTTRQAGETLSVKILPWTLSGGVLDESNVSEDELTFNYRFYRPYAPGKVELTSVESTEPKPWFNGHVLRADVGEAEVPDALTITWAHRDRPMQQDKPIYHEQDSIGPEPGTTYRISILNAKGEVIRRENGITGTQFVYTYGQASLDLNVEASAIDPVAGYLRLESMRDGFESWQNYLIPITVFKKPPQMAYVSFLNQSVAQVSDKIDPEDKDGETAVDAKAMVSFVNQSVAQESEELSSGGGGLPDGVNVSYVRQPVSQQGKLVPIVDSQLFEFPYLMLLRHGFEPSASQFFATVARPSDRVTDGYDLFEKEKNDTEYVNQGAQPWTPWGILSKAISYLDNEIILDATSDSDGVPTEDAMPGDVIFVGAEAMVIRGIDGKRITVGRGCVDTIPALHGKGQVVWFVDKQIASGQRKYHDGQTCVVAVRPHSLAAEIQPKDVVNKQLEVKLRADRPYPPGFLLGNGEHFFKGWDALADNFDYYDPQGKDLVMTWAHRNRVRQGETVLDHLDVGQQRPSDVMYRVWIGKRYTPRYSNRTVTITMGTYYTRDAGMTIKAEDLHAFGRRVGILTESTGYVYVSITVSAVDENELSSWQGYNTQCKVPTVPAKRDVDPNPGRPDPGTGGGETGGGGSDGGGTNPGNPDPGQPDRPNPDPDPGNPDPEPNPGNPDPDPVEPPPPLVVAGWSNKWDHDWAERLPDQDVKEDTE